RITDEAGLDVGTLECWSLIITPAVCTDGGGACPLPILGDIDLDGDVDQNDLNILLADRNKTVADSACGVPCDLNGDGEIDALDSRQLVTLCTRPRCATQ
ncbi:MAG: hypothetical protein L0Y56_22145, partial [Nitrospira sp.]|nr:hypothetical protein [Nitrospira sp.]